MGNFATGPAWAQSDPPFAAAATAAKVPAVAPGIEVEHGAYVLHKFAHANGRETYTIRDTGDGHEVSVDFAFTDRGHKVALVASLRSLPDLSPVRFDIKGDIARGISIDRSVLIEGKVVHLRDREIRTDRDRPDTPAFAIAGYAPVTFQMLLVQYWRRHGMPAALQTLPEGSVRIHRLGQDRLTLADHPAPLERIEVEGLIWGRETLWFDSRQQLVAAITTDAEFDHFEAIRDDYEGALPELIRLAGGSTAASLARQLRSAATAPHADIALVGGTLIDGSGRPPVQDATVLVHAGRIAAAGPRKSVKVPAGALVVDARGRWILPGLWDMHAHFEQVEWGPIYLAAGATTVRDCGNEFDFITAARDAIARGEGVGPRLLLAGIVDGTSKSSLGAVIVDDAQQARAWTRRYHDAGFQQMKVYSSINLESLQAVAAEAHRLGMTVTGHVPDGLTAFQAVDAGQDQINHMGYVAEMMLTQVPDWSHRVERLKAIAAVDPGSELGLKAVAFLRDHHTVIDPTMAIYEFSSASTAKPTTSFEPDAAKIAPELRGALLDVGPPSEDTAAAEAAFRKLLQLVGVLHRAGVPIVAGTDQAIPGWSLHREMELYVEAGFSPMEAIQSATIVAATAMGLQGESGTIEVGKRGDLIVVGADPLADIRNLRRVEQVVADRRLYQTAPLWRSVGFTP